MTRMLRYASVVLLGMLSVSCDSNTTAVEQEDFSMDSNSIEQVESLSLDDYYANIAKEVPGFGGMYLEEGNLNMYFLEGSAKTGAATYQKVLGIMNQEANVPEYIQTASPQIRRGDYDFIELRDWKNALKSKLRGEGMVFIDADERRNRVRVGITESLATSRISSMLADLGIPEGAVITEITDPIVPAVDLRDRYRPMEAGFEIERSDGAKCTLGFHVTRSGVTGFITNAHCTAQPGFLDNVSIFQENVTSNDFVGNENMDPPFQFYGGGGGAGPSPMQPQNDGYKHRKSDSAFIKYGSSITNNDINFGSIARTQSRSTGDNAGSRTKSGTFSITADKWYHWQHTQGLQLNKIGRSSGWTYGTIIDTCLDIEYPIAQGPGDPYFGDDLMLDCQYRVNGLSEAGDSGSPVFHWSGSGNNVTLYGILWGGTCETFNPFTGACTDFEPPFIYSTLGDVDAELGPSGAARLVTH